MSPRFRLLMVVAIILGFAVIAFAQQDVKGSKDHPLVQRMPEYFINIYSESQFDQVVFKYGKPPKPTETPVEGHVYKLRYIPSRTLTSKPSALQVIRNIQNALKPLGGEIISEEQWEAGNKRGTLIRLTKDNKTVWIEVKASPADYNLVIVEQQAMKQDVQADAKYWFDELERTGKATLEGIYFDTGKSTLKPESDAAIEQVAKLLKEQPKMKAFIVGHTDTVGDTTMNLKLSQERAKSVVNALVTKHAIPPARLTAFGNGPYAPVASNKDEDGRAKNRRVEMVQAGE